MSVSLAKRLRSVVGSGHLSTDAAVLADRSVDYTGRYRGRACALVRPGSAAEVAAVLGVCREAGAHVTVQGGRTSLVAGTVPHHDDVLLATDRLTGVGAVDETERRVSVGAGVPLAVLQQTAAAAGLLFGVDLAARDSATVGGMAATNAGGLHTIRYGNMGEQVLGLQVALPNGELLRRHSRVRRDNTGYDLPALFVGAEGTLGVITDLEVRLHRPAPHRVTAVCGFAELADLVDAGRVFADLDGIAALELIDGAAMVLTDEYLGVGAPVEGTWLLLVEVAADHDPTAALGDALAAARPAGEPAVAVDAAARHRLWRTREAITDILGVFGPPLKFDVSLPLEEIAGFTARAAAVLAEHAPAAIPVLFGHLGEGNLHLNVLRCTLTEDREHRLDAAMMELITGCGGNVSSEHGVGARKREYLPMSRGPADIAAMRSVKAAFDPTGYLNSAVLFS